jgi:D-threo-aldose 1-dehydrogenase
LKSQGVIGGIGIGVRDHQFLLGAIRRGEFDTILTYGDFNLVHQSARTHLFDEAFATDTAVILGSPVLMGYLTDRAWDELLKEHHADGSRPEQQRTKQVREWAQAHDLSILHLAVQYVLREPRISTILVGGSRPDEVAQNVRAATTPLPETIWQHLKADLEIA